MRVLSGTLVGYYQVHQQGTIRYISRVLSGTLVGYYQVHYSRVLLGTYHIYTHTHTEFCHDISDTQLPQVVPIVLPTLLKVIVQAELYSVRTRSRAVKIFHTFATLVYSMCGRFPVNTTYCHMTISCDYVVYQDAPETLLFPILPNYLATFVELLGNSSHGNNDPGLRRELIMSLFQLLQYFPRTLTPHILTLVTPVWNILVASAGRQVCVIIIIPRAYKEKRACN